MKNYVKLTLPLVFITLLTAATPLPQWQGKSGKYALKITPQALILTAPKSQSLLPPLTDMGDTEMRCDATRNVKPLSFIGPFLSFEQSDYWNCIGTAHPGAVTTFSTLDLKSSAPVSLTSIFTDTQILNALLKDSIVKKHIPSNKHFHSSQELINYLSKNGTGECVYAFTQDNLSRFAFHHVKGNQVAVRMGLSHGCEAARGHLTQVGFYLPIPTSWRGRFQLANLSKEGFLMKTHPKIQIKQQVKTPGYDNEIKNLIGG